jgi:quinol monooxygenase YgiN
MTFTQTMEVQASDERALHDHVASWHAEQAGIAPGYRRARVLADEKQPGRYLIEVDFSSPEEAARNNERPETNAWAAKLGELVTGAPEYRDFRLVCTTEES